MKTERQKHNQQIHTQSLSATKLGDGLVDPKLVLSWLLTTLGASAFWIGFLVPVREAGALLPQLFTAQKLRQVSVRKWWWVTGSVVQGAAVLGIAYAALTLTGDTAGKVVVGCVAVFALARSICSVSYKDVLGKTVEKNRRGLVTGTASSIAAGGVLIFGLLLSFNVIERNVLVVSALFLASLLWFIAAWRFTALTEEPSIINAQSSAQVWRQYWSYLTTDRELQKFLWVRGLLTATAVAPPFLLLLAERSDKGTLSVIGSLIIASSFATFISGRIWGRLADYSTPLVLAFAGLASAVGLGVSVLGVYVGGYEFAWFLPVVLFSVMVSYQGVRIARSIHLVNLATEETRAAYTAISNTIIGVVLLGTGVFGVLATMFSVQAVMVLLCCMSALGGLLAFSLKQP